VHPKLCKTAWEALVSLSERQPQEESKSPVSEGNHLSNINREGDFENFIPKFVQIVREPFQMLSSIEKA
jgi:hypothetical protein